MVREWLTIRGERWIDTLMLWINGLFWLPRRWYAQRSSPPNTAWHKLMQNPNRHWSRWPFSLQGRFFRWQGHLITDALGLTWFLGRQHQDMPYAFGMAQSARYGSNRYGYWRTPGLLESLLSLSDA